METSNIASDTRQGADHSTGTPTSDTSRDGAMGQNESREVLQERSAAIRRAGKQAVNPKPGKLPRRSGLGSQAVAGQRKLGPSVLANANTYDFPSDDDPASRSKRPANTAPFSPVMRQMRQEQLRQQQMQPLSPDEIWRKDEQARIDEQFEQEGIRAAQATAKDRPDSQVDLTEDDAIEQGGGAADPEGLRELPTNEVPVPNGNYSLRNTNAAEADALVDAPSGSTSDLLPRKQNPKRKRGRHSKGSRPGDPSPKKRFQPTRSAAEQTGTGDHQPVVQRPASRQTQDETQVRKKRGRPSKSAAPHTEADIFDVPDDDNIQVMAQSGESLNSAAAQVETIAEDQTPRATTSRILRATRSRQAGVAESSRNNLQPEAQTQANGRSNDQLSSPRATTENIDQQEDSLVHDPAIIDPAQLDDVNDPEHEDQAQNVEEEAEDGDSDGTADEEDPANDDDDEDHVDETEAQVEAAETDRHRLYGQWPKIREVMREVARHRGSTARIRDGEFREVLQACRDAVRDTAATFDSDQLAPIIAQCRRAIARAGAICANANALATSKQNKKRGWHIFKHLLPTLAKLLRAAVKAFERTDVDNSETEQISVSHLSVILELSKCVSEFGMNAYHGFKDLSRPIKRDVHERITIPLRNLHAELHVTYSGLVQAQERQRRNEEPAREIEAMDERRELQAKRRQLELRNQEKWKRMNQVRLALCSNSGNVKKQNHMRSCGMQLVETDAYGRPYLPTRLRDKRGDWSMREIVALDASLKKHVDTPDPLESMVFESLIAEQCPFRRDLTEKNLLEIVIKSNELKNHYMELSRNRGTAIAEWVTLIPRWMSPPATAHDDGSSGEDAIEIE